jgi:hypothetical protein
LLYLMKYKLPFDIHGDANHKASHIVHIQSLLPHTMLAKIYAIILSLQLCMPSGFE